MIKTILLDIEGTTTPIDFVHKTLFPFAKDRMEEYVGAGFGEMGNVVADLQVEHSLAHDPADVFPANSPKAVSDYLKYLIDADRKSTTLKAIQGEIWRSGYETGLLKSVVFDDVPSAFAKWNAASKTIAIYSSGSVLAQQLLFRNTVGGDMTPFISHYFDTNVGGKREKDSYLRLAELLEIPPDSILFISDIPAELAAARDAGLSTLLSVRPGNIPVVNDTWPVITTFDQID